MVKLRRVFESYLYLEAKKDLEDLKDYLGDDLFDSYMKIRDRIPKDQNEFKDFNKLKKMDKKDIQYFVSSFQSKSDKKKADKQEGAKKLYEDDDWVVYRITTYPAAQLYGKGTKWCITGRYPGHEERGQEYFDDYIEDNNLDGGYYFYLNKKNQKKKFCVLQTKDNKIHSIWDAEDTNRGSSLSSLHTKLPKVDGINIKKYFDEDLFIAIRNEDLRRVKSIVNSDIGLLESRNLYQQTPLMLSCDRNLYDISEFLIKKGADVNVVGIHNETPLRTACKILKNKDLGELLLKNGADPNIMDDYNTLLGFACKEEDSDIVDILLKYGANPNIKDRYDNTPIFYAYLSDNLDLVKLLVKNGADVNQIGEYGSTILWLACNNAHREDSITLDFIRFLIKNGADVNQTNEKGVSCLSAISRNTCGKEELDIMDYLLKNGADPNLRDKYGYTPLSLAKEQGNKDIIELLKEYGAKE